MSQPPALGHSSDVDPNTYAFVAATAFFTALTFAIAVLNVLAYLLQYYNG